MQFRIEQNIDAKNKEKLNEFLLYEIVFSYVVHFLFFFLKDALK